MSRTPDSERRAIAPPAAPDMDTADPRRWWILLVLCLSLVVITLDNTILNVALPRLSDDLGASNSQLQWIVDSYTLVFAGLLLTAGSLGDRFGRKGALQIGLVVFAFGSALSALVTDPVQLIAARAVMGVGGAFIMPSTLSLLTNVFPEQERGRAIGVWAGVSALGVGIGPLLGGFLVERVSWHAVFTVNLPIAALAIAAGAWLIPTSRDPEAPPLDLPGAGLSIAGLWVAIYTVIEAPAYGWVSSRIIGGCVAAVLLIGLFFWREVTAEFPMLDLSFFRNPRFSAACLAVTLVFFAMFGFSFLLTQYFQFVLGYDAAAAGIRMLPLALTVMVVAPLSARLVEWLGTKAVVASGLLILTVGLALHVDLTAESSYPDVAWRMVLAAIGIALTLAPSTESIMGSLPLAKTGVGSAVNDTTRQIGGGIGIAILGSVLSSVYGGKVDALFGTARGVSAADVVASRNSLGSALDVADRVSLTAPDVGDGLARGAKDAFVAAMRAGALVAAGVAAVAALIVFKWLPARVPSVAGIRPQSGPIPATEPV